MKRMLSFISIILLIGIFITACAKEPTKIVNLPEVNKPAETKEIIVEDKIVEAVDSLVNEKDLSPSETWQIGSKTLKVLSIGRDEGVKVDVDGQQGVIASTKNFEVVNDLKIETLKTDFSNLDKPKTTIKAEEFKLGEHEYLLNLDPLILNEKNIKLKEVGEDYVYIEVGTDASQKVLLNTEKTINGFSFKLLKSFYLDSQRQPYAWIKIVNLL